MIKTLYEIPRGERRWLMHYLSTTPVRHWAGKLNGKNRIWLGYVATTSEVGRLRTLFGKYKTARPMNGKKFLVKDIFRVWKKSRHRYHYLKCSRYIAMLKAWKPLQVVVTIAWTKTGNVIADGNTRTVAWYEHLKQERLHSRPLLVYLVDDHEQ